MSTDNQPSMLAAQLRAQAASLLAHHQACYGFEHKLLRGMEREVPIRQFFSRHLANRFCVETGAIASADGMLDAQFDCLVTESHLTGTLFAGGSASIFPVEAVHVLLEVRSGAKLRLETAARQFQKARSLRRTEGVIRHGHDPPRSGQTGQPVHTVVAYSGPTNSTTAAQQLESANSQYKNNGCRYPLDFVLVLSARKQGSLETGYLVWISADRSHPWDVSSLLPDCRGNRPLICKGTSFRRGFIRGMVREYCQSPKRSVRISPESV